MLILIALTADNIGSEISRLLESDQLNKKNDRSLVMCIEFILSFMIQRVMRNESHVIPQPLIVVLDIFIKL